ncbi:MAG: AraC family transcriptional regulator [Ruminococcus sp.]|uniref:helix-turn-helix domain-containing protein n=1 Tax=Ruminococcus sp. TaxID=41978 RepID=UPI0025E59461|nr:AraC family transcriptional regulator [Ruminococcus sp.]MCR4795718.1 AraC family transcriptional regulator [Ruminococcus sp.]
MAEFRIFPDIRLIVGKADDIGLENGIEISFCKSGICEYAVGNEYYYLTAENCIILRRGADRESRISYSSDYCGISLLIDSRYNGKAFEELLDMSDILRNMQSCEQCIFSADDNIKRLSSEIYDTFSTSMLRIKVLELLMIMGEKRCTAGEKSERIRKIGSFVCKNLCEHYTIAKLSEIFAIDRTTLKILFRQTFGCPVYTYAKNRKMFRAAELLRDTEMKIIDIAEEVGYCNASKFSGAFRDVMGIAPKTFQMERKNTRKYKNRTISAEFAY